MRIDNRKVKNAVISTYLAMIVFAILIALVLRFLNLFNDSVIYVFFALIVVLVGFHFIASYIEYNSDGEKVIVISNGFLLTTYINYRQNQLEFKKNQLVGFKIKNFIIYKSLVVLIKNYEGKVKKERFNVTLLKNKKLRYVKQSLRKIVKENRKA